MGKKRKVYVSALCLGMMAAGIVLLSGQIWRQSHNTPDDIQNASNHNNDETVNGEVAKDGMLQIRLLSVKETSIHGEKYRGEVQEMIDGLCASDVFYGVLMINEPENLSVLHCEVEVKNMGADSVRWQPEIETRLKTEGELAEYYMQENYWYPLQNPPYAWYTVQAGETCIIDIYAVLSSAQICSDGTIAVSFSGSKDFIDTGITKKATGYKRSLTNEEIRSHLVKNGWSYRERHYNAGNTITEDCIVEQDELLSYVIARETDGEVCRAVSKRIKAVSLYETYDLLPEKVRQRGIVAQMVEKYVESGYRKDELKFLIIEAEHSIINEGQDFSAYLDSGMWLYDIDENSRSYPYGYPDDCFFTEEKEDCQVTRLHLKEGDSIGSLSVYVLPLEGNHNLHLGSSWSLTLQNESEPDCYARLGVTGGKDGWKEE